MIPASVRRLRSRCVRNSRFEVKQLNANIYIKKGRKSIYVKPLCINTMDWIIILKYFLCTTEIRPVLQVEVLIQ